MSTNEQRRWCLFTSAGDRSAVRRWVAGDELREWDLVAAYYGHRITCFARPSWDYRIVNYVEVGCRSFAMTS